MEDDFHSVEIDGRKLCVSALSRQAYEKSGGKGLGGDFGCFLYEASDAGIDILAKVSSPDAGRRLLELLTRPQHTSQGE